MEKLITFHQSKSRTAEAFRTLRTNIQFSELEDELKTIVITSTSPGEGKSTVIANLAVAFAQSGKKVLLVDCDLRRPTVHKNLNISNEVGLTNLLIKERKADECMKVTNINNLMAIPCGPIPPNPSELLGSRRMAEFMDYIKEYFDIILLDAPPVLAVTDAQVISKVADGVLLLACYGKTEKKALVKAKEQLEKVDARILGVVLNKVRESKDLHYGKYYEYYESKD